MKTQLPFRIVFVLASFTVVGIGHAAFRADEPQIGDLGPDGEYVCETLEKAFPSADIQLYSREILATDRVIVRAKSDVKPYSIDDHLVNADWIKFHASCLVGR